MTTPPIRRYVAIGDSSTEGLDDPDGRGGYRGWANRLAELVAAWQGGLLYANLGIRGKRTGEILAEQLEPALAMQPDLVTVFSGTNDVVGRRFEIAPVAADIETLQSRLTGAGATVLTFTLPDLRPVMPLAALVTERVEALNEAIRAAARKSGAIVVDIARHPVASDPRLWSLDRLHANAVGHARIAQALAEALGVPGAGSGWSEPLPPQPRPGLTRRIAAEMRWTADHLVPWVWRHLRGRSSGDGITAKRPELVPVPVAQPSGTRPGA
ncbi:MAG: SGNH/GDSL hydrolase family protein [Gemmatimonadales bacterium]